MPDEQKTHSSLSDQDFYALVNAVTSRCSNGCGLVDRDGLRVEFDRILGGLFEQYESFRDELEGMESMREAAERERDGLKEQLEAKQKRLDWYEGLQGEANDADFASMQSDVEYHALLEQLETAHGQLTAGRQSEAELRQEWLDLKEQFETLREALRAISDRGDMVPFDERCSPVLISIARAALADSQESGKPIDENWLGYEC